MLRQSVANQSKKLSAKTALEDYKMTTENKLKVQLIRSPIGTKESHRATVRGLGLRGINSVSELQDTPAVRGMINKISYLVKVI
jgi:large subunit ribosomal protein L30